MIGLWELMITFNMIYFFFLLRKSFVVKWNKMGLAVLILYHSKKSFQQRNYVK